MIIALGESIVAIGAGAGFELETGEVIAAVLAITAVASLWWAYFDIVAIVAERRLTEAPPGEQAPLARDSYSYLHFPMIAGIVLLAVGLKKTELAVDEPLKTVPAVALCGGVALYLLGHIAFRYRNVGTLNRHRALATVVVLALIPLALEVDAPDRGRRGDGRAGGPDRLRGDPLPRGARARARQSLGQSGRDARRADPHAAFGGVYLLTENTAPAGSLSTAVRTGGSSKGATTTVPPSSNARAAAASASSTEKMTPQLGGVLSGWPFDISQAVASAKPGGASCSARPRLKPGSPFSSSSPYPGLRKNV